MVDAKQRPVRYFLMAEALQNLTGSIKDTNSFSFFDHFNESLAIIHDDGVKLIDDGFQYSKAQRFIAIAIERMNKHFTRWMSVKMLPAALLAEAPLAVAAARAIMGSLLHIRLRYKTVLLKKSGKST